MAYYAALVSAVQFLKEMSLSEYQYPKSLFEKQQIKSLYEKLRHLQVLLENHSPNDKEVAGLLDRIRDAACLAQDLVEFHIPNEPEIKRSSDSILYQEYYPPPSESYIPAAVEEVKSILELQIAEKTHEPSPSCWEFIHIIFCCHEPEWTNEEFLNHTLRSGYRNLENLTKQLGSLALMGYKTLASLMEVVSSITMEKRTLDDVANLEEEFNPIVINGYQDLLKLKEELDASVEKEDHDLDRVKKAVDSILGRGSQNLERVKEAFDFIVGKGYKYLLEKVKEVVDLTVGRGYQDLEWLKEKVDSVMERGYEDRKLVKAEVDFVVIEGYQKWEMLKEELDAVLGCQISVSVYGDQPDSIRLRGYQDLKRARGKIVFFCGKGI